MKDTRDIPQHGEIWKHFKGNLYEIIEKYPEVKQKYRFERCKIEE